jgi:hypothetical protein
LNKEIQQEDAGLNNVFPRIIR